MSPGCREWREYTAASNFSITIKKGDCRRMSVVIGGLLRAPGTVVGRFFDGLIVVDATRTSGIRFARNHADP